MLVIHTFLEITIICTVTENSYTNQNCNSYGKSFDRLTIIKTNRKHFFQKLEIYLFFFPLPSNREEFVENFVEKKKKNQIEPMIKLMNIDFLMLGHRTILIICQITNWDSFMFEISCSQIKYLPMKTFIVIWMFLRSNQLHGITN